jgi:hypothetical protein
LPHGKADELRVLEVIASIDMASSSGDNKQCLWKLRLYSMHKYEGWEIKLFVSKVINSRLPPGATERSN